MKTKDAINLSLLCLLMQADVALCQDNSTNGTTSNHLSNFTTVGREVREYFARNIVSNNITSWDSSTWTSNKLWLEKEYAKLGYSLDIRYRGELEIDVLVLMTVTVTETEFRSMQQARLKDLADKDLPAEIRAKMGPPRVLTREEDLANWMTNRFNLGRLPFDKEQWNDPDGAKDWMRYRIFKDVLATQKLEGMPVEELESLLGKPHSERPGAIRYFMGRELRFISLDNSALEFAIENGRIKSWKFVRD